MKQVGTFRVESYDVIHQYHIRQTAHGSRMFAMPLEDSFYENYKFYRAYHINGNYLDLGDIESYRCVRRFVVDGSSYDPLEVFRIASDFKGLYWPVIGHIAQYQEIEDEPIRFGFVFELPEDAVHFKLSCPFDTNNIEVPDGFIVT